MYIVILSILLAFLEAKRWPLKSGYSVVCISDSPTDFLWPDRKLMNK